MGNQNLYLHWGLFAENFPEEILKDLSGNKTDEKPINVRRSYLYNEDTMFDEKRIGLGRKSFHLVDFHDVPDGMLFNIMGFFQSTLTSLAPFLYIQFEYTFTEFSM